VHIIGHWNYPAGTRKPVYVTSNCEHVELLVNGKSLGRGEVSDRYLFTFPEVGWEPGEIKAIGYQRDQVAVTQVKRTAGAPLALRLTPILGPLGLQADGSDVALIDVEVVDDQGQRCPTFQQRVEFDCGGAAVWRGGYNSGKTNSINNAFLDVECGINRVAIRATRSSGPITLTARCGTLQPATLNLTSHGVLVAHGYSFLAPPFPAAPPLLKPLGQFLAGTNLAAHSHVAAPTACLKAFSYSGPAAAVRVQQGARDGARIYADRDFVFRGLPEALHGCDWIQTANADKLYSAVDLMELAANADSVVYIAHDDRLPRPGWLQRQFKPSNLSLAIGGRPMKLFERAVRGGESLTLGSNAEDRRLKSCNMYVVFVKRGENGFRARS
jgi:beta-galactosidase